MTVVHVTAAMPGYQGNCLHERSISTFVDLLSFSIGMTTET